jgi:hypothetical protein
MSKRGKQLDFWQHFVSNMQIFKVNFQVIMNTILEKIWGSMMDSFV